MFVLTDRGMHVLHIDVLKNDSIVGYVVFDFDLLLSATMDFNIAPTTIAIVKTKTKHNKQHQSAIAVVI